MIAAVCPIAFFTKEHIEMTDTFLSALEPEVDRIGVWHNGGTLADEGLEMLAPHTEVELYDARGWRFYQMWNDGVAWAGQLNADAALVLNNDITWDTGTLGALADMLLDAPEDVAVVSPTCHRPIAGWCFAVRPWMWQQIDERYHTWWGDNELERLMVEAGWRCIHTDAPIYHPWPLTTFQHIEGVEEMRLEDQVLYESKWS
jgi:hypothetical protein